MSVLAPWPRAAALRVLSIRDMVVHAHIGVYPQEQGVTQRVRVNVHYGVKDGVDLSIGQDDLSRTVSYEHVVLLVRDLVAQGHVRLVETLAERVAAGVMANDRVHVVRVRIEKLDVFDDLDSVGVEIERWRDA